jgi:hypothetical protein
MTMAMTTTANEERFILFTPGFSQVTENSARKRKPFKRFPTECTRRCTWLKPGVNETWAISLVAEDANQDASAPVEVPGV